MTRTDFPNHDCGPDEIPTIEWQDTTPTNRPSAVRYWHLLVGAVVEVRQDGQVVRTGLVEDVTASGDIVWIAADGFDGRTIIDKREGYKLAIVQALPQSAADSDGKNPRCPPAPRDTLAAKAPLRLPPGSPNT